MNDQPTHPSKDVKQPPSHLTSQNEMVSTDPQAQGGGELDTAIEMSRIMRDTHQHIIDGTFIEQLTPHQYTTREVEKLITTRLRAQLNSLEDEGPEERHIPAYDHTTTLNANYGFNEACDQWRTLLAKKRDTL